MLITLYIDASYCQIVTKCINSDTFIVIVKVWPDDHSLTIPKVASILRFGALKVAGGQDTTLDEKRRADIIFSRTI